MCHIVVPDIIFFQGCGEITVKCENIFLNMWLVMGIVYYYSLLFICMFPFLPSFVSVLAVELY